MGLRREPLHVMLGPRALGPLVGVRPKAKLEVESARRSLFADESEHLEIPVALGIIERHSANLIAGDVDQKRVGKVHVIAHHVAREVIAQAEGQAEPVESVGYEGREIIAPEALVVIPGFILYIAD